MSSVLMCDDEGRDLLPTSAYPLLNEMISQLPEKSPSIIVHKVELPDKRELHILREDLIPFYLGGNKARKTFVFDHYIKTHNVDALLTYGSRASNHVRALVIAASRRKIPITVVIPENDSKFVTSNQKIASNLGAHFVEASIDKIPETIEREKEYLDKQFRKPLFIPGGGHHLLGTVSIVDLMLKIASFESKQKIEFKHIFLASGTGGTQAGLIFSKHLIDREVSIHGISVARSKKAGTKSIVESLREISENYRIRNVWDDIIFRDEYVCGGYGRFNDKIIYSIREALAQFGIPLDPIYTGKAFYGMMEQLKKIPLKDKTMFIHTGGTPLFYDFIEETFG